MIPIPDADRHERRYHHEIQKHAKAAMNHWAALRRWNVKAADDGVDLVEIAEAAVTTIERAQDVIERERMLADENGWR